MIEYEFNWDKYTYDYKGPTTKIQFPEHINHIILSTNKEIGGLIMFEKKPSNTLEANSIFLTAGEEDKVDFTRILNTVVHPSYMIFHTHPLRKRGYNGYSGTDLTSFFYYTLINYKAENRIHFCLSTGHDIHFSFLDNPVVEYIRTIIKLIKRESRLFTSDKEVQEAFMIYFHYLCSVIEYYCVTSARDMSFVDAQLLKFIEHFTFTPLDKAKWNDFKIWMNQYKPANPAMYAKYETVKGFKYINENYERISNTIQCVFSVPGIAPEEVVKTIGLFKTTSSTYDAFTKTGSVVCIDSGKIYNETDPWQTTSTLAGPSELSGLREKMNMSGGYSRKTRKLVRR